MSFQSISWRTFIASSVSVASAGFLFLYEKRRRLRKARLAAVADGRVFNLLPAEVEYGMKAGRPAIVTMFRGIIPEKMLQRRVADIIGFNPWLAGRLRTSPWTGQPSLWVPDAPNKSSSVVVMKGSLSQGLPAALYCSGGEAAADAEAMLFKVGLLIDDELQACLLIVSLCHAIGDAFTLYSLYKMLDERSEITAMSPERDMSYPAMAQGINGPDGNRKQWWLDLRRAAGYSPTPLLSSAPGVPLYKRLLLMSLEIFGTLRRKLFLHTSSNEVKVICRRINTDWVDQQKLLQSNASAGSQLSTNDVVTSWFMCKCGGVGTMNVNVRGRKAVLTSSLAGNYVMEFCYFPGEMMPGNIRRSLVKLSTQCAFDGLPTPPPKTMCVPRAHVTSWAAFDCNVCFPGCEQLLHWPNVAQLLSPIARSRMIEDWDEAYNVMMLFRPTPDTMGVVILSRDIDLVHRLRSDPCLGEDLVDDAAKHLASLSSPPSHVSD